MHSLRHTFKLKARSGLSAALFCVGLGIIGCNASDSSIEELNEIVELETSETPQSTKDKTAHVSSSSEEKNITGNPEMAKAKESIPANEVDIFKPLFEGGGSERAATLGEGPHKIGMPINGYASDYIKEAFDNYNFDIEYSSESIAQEETARDICDFVKVALFSDEIDLSEFYWHHPNTKNKPLKKIESHMYRFTDSDGLFVLFNYFPYEPGYHSRNEIEDKKFGYTYLKNLKSTFVIWGKTLF